MKLISRDYNPVSGMTEEYWGHPDGKVTIRRLQDVEPGLISNVAELNTHSAKGRVGKHEGLGRKVASIPMGIVEDLAKNKRLNILTCTEKELKALLNDPEYSKLRTAHGRL